MALRSLPEGNGFWLCLKTILEIKPLQSLNDEWTEAFRDVAMWWDAKESGREITIGVQGLAEGGGSALRGGPEMKLLTPDLIFLERREKTRNGRSFICRCKVFMPAE